MAPYPVGWRRCLALHRSLVDFEARGFRTEPAATRAALQGVAEAFLDGYNAQLATAAGRAPDLHSFPEHLRGLAAEGAAMAAVLLDSLNPLRGRRFDALLDAHQDRYAYLLYVGGGWAMAKLHRTRLRRLGARAPLLRWLAYDGMGFCHAFFAGRDGLRRWNAHPATCPATCDIRYQGFGRSIWFRDCGDPQAVARRVAGLPERHHGDAWSGVGLAATYAGGVDEATYPLLLRLSGPHAPAVAQGAAFGAEAWRLCGYTPPHAHKAVPALTGVPAQRAAQWTWDARRGLDRPCADAPDYRQWRLRVQRHAAAVAAT
jgi:enediyne biosynthesis protein E3